MGRALDASFKAGERTTRIAERLLDAGEPIVELPGYVQELADAARKGRVAGVASPFEGAVKRWQGQVNRLGQGATREAGEYTIRSATQQLVKDLRKAKPEAVDKIVDRWVLEKARYQARVVARTESVQALRDSQVASAREQPWCHGIRWTLSPNHPKADVCFPAGTMVQTEHGQRPIESIATGDMVLTHRGRLRPVVRTSRTIQDEGLIRLRFQAGTSQVLEVTATRNHPFATARGWKRADELCAGDRGYVHDDAERTQARRPCDGTAGTCRSDFPRSSPCGHQRTTCAARCAGPGLRVGHTGTADDAQASTSPRTSGAETSRSPLSRPSIAGCQPPSAPLTSEPVAHQTCSTCLGGACRGWDCQPRATLHPCTRSSSVSCASCGGPSACCTQGTEHPGTTPSNTSDWESWEETERDIHDSFSAAVLTSSAYLDSNIRTVVFNLEVSEDHTYVANGLLVHNCDMYADQDSHGIGAGCYPADSVPTSHANCLCSVSPLVDADHFKRELAKAKGEPEPPRPWESGVTETSDQWLRKQPASAQEAILGPTRARLLRGGRSVTSGQQLTPVHVLLGGSKPSRLSGPRVLAGRVIKADRASMVRPFPELRQRAAAKKAPAPPPRAKTAAPRAAPVAPPPRAVVTPPVPRQPPPPPPKPAFAVEYGKPIDGYAEAKTEFTKRLRAAGSQMTLNGDRYEGALPAQLRHFIGDISQRARAGTGLKATRRLRSVSALPGSHKQSDALGLMDWDGDLMLRIPGPGPQQANLEGQLFNTVIHETVHTLGGTTKSAYRGVAAVIEEVATEELSQALGGAVTQIEVIGARLDLSDVSQAVKTWQASPTTVKVAGAYGNWRKRVMSMVSGVTGETDPAKLTTRVRTALHKWKSKAHTDEIDAVKAFVDALEPADANQREFYTRVIGYDDSAWGKSK